MNHSLSASRASAFSLGEADGVVLAFEIEVRDLVRRAADEPPKPLPSRVSWTSSEYQQRVPRSAASTATMTDAIAVADPVHARRTVAPASGGVKGSGVGGRRPGA